MGLVPMLTLFFAYLYLDEIPQFRQIVGIIPVLVGGYLLTKPVKVDTIQSKESNEQR